MRVVLFRAFQKKRAARRPPVVSLKPIENQRSKIAPYIDTVRAANGEQEIAFKNGSRILFGARESGFGRGFDEVDILVERYGIHMIGRQSKGDMRWMAGIPGTPGVSYGDTLTHAVHTYIIESVLGETNE